MVTVVLFTIAEKKKMTKLGVRQQKNKKNMVCLHGGILLIHEHTWNPAMRSIVEEMGEPRR